ncbi:MAG: glycosyltransferase family 39 protein [Acidobacteria bacterium]|nr:glycosyltransferase family 39 protein [Acidobacteriota bacterium]
MTNGPIPKWIRWLALLVILGQLGAIGLVLAGRLHGPQRNLLPQALIGGAMALSVLAAYALRFHPGHFRPAPARLGVAALTVLALGLCGLYFLRNRPVLTLPYDLGGWSESYFLTDIIKWRTGTPLYTAPDDSNSGTYTPGAPAISYFLASLLGRADSIRAYRFLLQGYLLLAALFAGAATWNLLRISDPDRFPRVSRLWLPFFVCASFLVATNAETNAFNIFLHNDPFSVLVSSFAFWVLTQFALRQSPRWLAAMAVLPALGFLAKQYLAVLVPVFVVYLWLDGRTPLRRLITFGVVAFAILGATIASGFLIWGDAYRYWVFEIMGTHIVSFFKLSERFADAAWFVLLGLFGGLVLLRGERFSRLFGLWTGWLVMAFGGIYTSGITFSPTHLGPASMVAASFALVALATLWPLPAPSDGPPSQQWLQVGAGFLAVVAVFAGLGFTRVPQLTVTPDLARYVSEVEREFNGLPADRVLIDIGEWIYLRQNALMKDRMAILDTHRTPHYGILERVRRREYARILVHLQPNSKFSYEIGGERDIQREMLVYYREVRRIPAIQGMERWRYHFMVMSDIVVLEPVPREPTDTPAPAGGADRR